MKFNRNTKVQHLQVRHFFGNILLCFPCFYYICNRKFFTSRYLRTVGHQWLRLDDILPCFFINTVDKGWNARNIMCPVESPMQGNNWRPTQPDGVERHTFFTFNLLSIILCRFRMTHNGFWLGEGYEALACVSGSFCQTRVIRWHGSLTTKFK